MPTVDQKREIFFKMLLGKNTGYLCIAKAINGNFEEAFFNYPEGINEALSYINSNYMENLYFCPQLFVKRERKKHNVKVAPVLWADLDDCDPSLLKHKPSIVIESSDNRYQGYWLLENETADPYDVEDVCRRIAYFYRDKGVDASGWDLTQLLRVPFTNNYKYKAGENFAYPEVKIIEASKTTFKFSDFDYLPKFEDYVYDSTPMPDLSILPDGNELLEARARSINPRIWELMTKEHPDHTWSTALWNLEMLLFENGFNKIEVFSIVMGASCNKYLRDGRPMSSLWKEVSRCEAKYKSQEGILSNKIKSYEQLLTDEEKEYIDTLAPTFVERYISWASTLGDAAPQYHQAGAFVILSSLMSGTLHLPTSFGKIILNLWFMILADTTLTRKSTAMDIAMDMLEEISPDVIAATDGSLEGLMGTLALRPGQPSIFLKDEFSGLVESMAKKDYMAGMAEMLTKLYDGKLQKRILKKEIIEVRDPRLIIFGGGIRNKVAGALTLEHIGSGFVPRFIFITAESDVRKIRPLGPPTLTNSVERVGLIQEMVKIRNKYDPIKKIKIGDSTSEINAPNVIEAKLTDEAWIRYNKFESDMVDIGVKHQLPEAMTPMYDRLSKSVLKCAVLIAGSRQLNASPIVLVELEDVLRAINFGTRWRLYAEEVVSHVGKSDFEKMLDRVYAHLRSHPRGVPKATIMRYYHISAMDMARMLDTLEQRALISRIRNGKTEMLFALE